MEAKWFKRYQDVAERSQEQRFLRSQQCESQWYERCEKKNRKLEKKSAEIASLIVESSPQVFLLYLTGIQVQLLHEKSERLKLECKFNVCGALGNNHKVHL